MEIVKKILPRILLLSVLLVAMNYLYKRFFLEKDIQKYSDVINLVRAIPLDADIVYIGESSNITFRSDDLDKRPISAFIADHYPDLKVYDITKPASHAGIYKVLLENIPDSSNVSTVIVTLNLRSFNAQWIHSKLETALQKSMVLLKPNPPLYNRFLLSFKAYDIKSDKERDRQVQREWEKDEFKVPFDFQFSNVEEWDEYVAKEGVNNPDGSRNQELTELACHYIKGYAFQIDTANNPRIKDFNRIIQLAKKRGWNLVFNLLAENTERAEELVGDDLLYFMQENRKLLINYFTRKGVTVVDNMDDIENDLFVDQDWTTEHYAEKGRKTIAGNVADSLQKYYPGHYVGIDYKNFVQTAFFNDCDQRIIWGQMQTITDEEAYSGKNSSRTGNGNDYSITFEYPLKIIPDSLKSKINISLKVYRNSLNDNGKLVIQAQGEHMEYYWNGFELKEQVRKANSWEDYHLTIDIPDNIKQADLMKIYVYNPLIEIVFVDDFRIEFE
ncbi:MAG: DUF4843 domain-containing protein [Bacteroidetes bacterium]|nr:MAG: DUF4843 domain-containing protein [Bacteroidota bacterium]